MGHENDENLDVDGTPHQKLKFNEDDLDYIDGTNKKNWYVRFQVEIGI